ncbi:CIC11C00000004965 [Sungouiella intermedia]|uniref:CIC11C00000003938 n=1 Tax=Sungouiella intermedia TaxID=45354 RepID=A0A1L0DQK6_9ASCO|nr:CIC11C00000004965 [[Candida] intermedia]SGZ58992.1 CIC11C00000003938 [[Candida] intermedia]
MSTYAEVAAESGPIGAEKIPEPAQVNRTTEPQGSVETVPKEDFEKIKKQAKKTTEEAVKAGKEHVQDFKKELKELKEELKPYVEKAVDYVKDKYAATAAYVSSWVNKDTINAAGQELQNPVVVGQLAVIAGGATAGYFITQESGRINSDNKYVVAIHAGIITGLILADVYVFQQLYPKYKK